MADQFSKETLKVLESVLAVLDEVRAPYTEPNEEGLICILDRMRALATQRDEAREVAGVDSVDSEDRTTRLYITLWREEGVRYDKLEKQFNALARTVVFACREHPDVIPALAAFCEREGSAPFAELTGVEVPDV